MPACEIAFCYNLSWRTTITTLLFPRRHTIALLLLLASLTGCNYPTATSPAPAPSAAATSLLPPTQAPRLLPHALYFLSGRESGAQVWRLEADGLTLRRLTDESEDVAEYDVSAVDGRFVYRVDNRIYILNADGSGWGLLVDNSGADEDAPDYAYRDAVSSPRFAPDGGMLAYAQGGVWLLDFASGVSQRILENQIGEEGRAGEVYTPVAWSPSGSRLLIAIAQSEGSTLGVWHLDTGELVRLEADTLLCCQAAWAPDGGSVLLASASLGLIEPGLWRFDAASGARSTLVETVSGETYNFAGWPLQLPNGDLRYFYASSAGLPEGDLPLYMVQSASDGSSGRGQLRSDAFSIREALWAPDGSLALIVQTAVEGLHGPLVLAFADERLQQVLVDFGYALRWGP